MDHLQTIQQIFSARFLRIPDYQRGYAWEDEHLEALLEDLDLLDPGAEHYTGTLVLHRRDDQPTVTDEEGREHGQFDVVDGQQRLTTIVLLLDVIRRELEPDSTLARGIKKTYVLTRDEHGLARAKLTLNRDTRDYFERNVIADEPGVDGPKIRSEERLRDAHRYFREHVRRRLRNGEGGREWLLGLLKKVTNGLKLTVYEVPRASDVGVIFEVMNNRGKRLSEMEKVKNYLLYLVSKTGGPAAEQLGGRVNEAWTTVFEGLMDARASDTGSEDQLLRAHWLMAYDHRPKNWSGHDSIKQRFSLRECKGRSADLVREVGDYVTSLREFSFAYCDLVAPARSNAFSAFREDEAARRDVVRAAVRLVRLQALASFLPLLAGVRLAYPRDAGVYLSFLDLCEKYAFRVYRWEQRRANAGQSSLYKLGNDVYHHRVSPESARASLAALLLYYAPQKDFLRGLEEHTDWYTWYGAKYFLYEYEEHLARGRAVQLPWDVLAKRDKESSIEHILPQTPTDPYWTDRWAPEDIKACLHDIGNLTLTFDNTTYGNKPFPKKKGAPGAGPCYANSNLFMERQLATYADWTKAELMKRRAEIVAWARERWGVADAGGVEVVPEEDEDE